jgi:hypothetical protein
LDIERLIRATALVCLALPAHGAAPNGGAEPVTFLIPAFLLLGLGEIMRQRARNAATERDWESNSFAARRRQKRRDTL